MPTQTIQEPQPEQHEPDPTRLAGTEADQREAQSAPPPQPSRGEKGYKLDVPVSFGTVSISDSHAAISCKVGKSGKDGVAGINIKTAEQYLCGSRLDVAIEVSGDQEWLEGMEPEPVFGVCDVKSFGVKPKEISFRLKFPIDHFDYSKLSKLANLSARLKANRLSDAEGDDAPDPHTAELPYDNEQSDAA